MPPILMRMQNARTHINYLIEAKQSFQLSSSNYTTGIKSDAFPGKYVAQLQSNRAFAAFAKLKKAVKDKPVPDISNDDVRYFQHNFRKDIYIDTVFNIDIKSAYATVLFKDGLIDADTFAYLSKSSKQDRLSSVGMLASRKEVFEFKNGSPVSEEEIVSPLSGFFFYAVQKTFEIMDELRRICGMDYLYTWVDGIYFLPNDEVRRSCIDYLDSTGYKFSSDVLQEFEVKIKQDVILVTFKKENKLKIFNLPGITSEFRRLMMDSILLLNKTKKDEKDFRKVSRVKR